MTEKISRREFLKIAGAVVGALATGAGCTPVAAEPGYTHKEEIKPGTESSLNKPELIKGVKVYGLDSAKIQNKQELARLQQDLNREFQIRKEKLNPNDRYLEYWVTQSVWDKFESDKKGELVEFVKKHLSYLNNMPVADGVRFTGQTLKDSGTQVRLRRIVVIADEAIRDLGYWNQQVLEDWSPTADANARWTMKEDYRTNIGQGHNFDYNLIHEGIHYWLGFMNHTDFSISERYSKSFREIRNPDGAPIPASLHEFHAYQGGIMAAGRHPKLGVYLEDFVIATLKRMRELNLQKCSERASFLGKSFSEEISQKNVLLLKDQSNKLLPPETRVFFYATEGREETLINPDTQKPMKGVFPVFAKSSEVIAKVGSEGEIVFPQKYLQESLVDWNGPKNKNFFVIAEVGPGEYLYQHLTVMPFVKGFWQGHRDLSEMFEMEVKLKAP